jgi:hypothetical protein
LAVDLIISLTDAEQAKVSEWLDLIKPGLTSPQKKILLEALGRRLLREELLSRVTALRSSEVSEQATADREVFAADDPLTPVAIPGPTPQGQVPVEP